MDTPEGCRRNSVGNSAVEWRVEQGAEDGVEGGDGYVYPCDGRKGLQPCVCVPCNSTAKQSASLLIDITSGACVPISRHSPPAGQDNTSQHSVRPSRLLDGSGHQLPEMDFLAGRLADEIHSGLLQALTQPADARSLASQSQLRSGWRQNLFSSTYCISTTLNRHLSKGQPYAESLPTTSTP